MRPHDEAVFRNAAQRFQAWILVRVSNKGSLEYIGQRIYQAKPIGCKPKTASSPVNEPGKRIRGLVADPVRWPEAFADKSIEKRVEVLELWKKFTSLHNLGEFRPKPGGGFEFDGARSSGAGYGIDAEPGSKHEGCLTYEGKYIYGDYDIFDIVFLNAKQGPVSQVPIGPKNAARFQTVDYQGSGWKAISEFLNDQLGPRLIQHGSQFDWKKDAFEAVEAFAPTGEVQMWRASETAQKYHEWNRT